MPGGTMCGDCNVVRRCALRLDPARRRALSHKSIARSTARAENGGPTILFAAEDPKVALSACRQGEQLSVSFPAELRLQCFGAGAPR
jgi:hypothetical protein